MGDARKKSVLICAASVLLGGVGAAQAAITTYTSQAAFNAAVINPGVDGFDGFLITGPTPGPLNRSAGAYGYTVSTAPNNNFFGAGTTGNPWLSTNTASDTIDFALFTGGTVQAAGGNFFGSDINGAFAAGNIIVRATDASGTTTQTIIGATTSSFLGFVSDGPLLSVQVQSVQPTAGFLWPTVDNFTLAVVPEPTMLGGLAIAGAMLMRRRR